MEVTEPAEVDMAVWFARYQEIIARSRGLRSSRESTMAEFGNFIIYIIMAGTLIGALASSSNRKVNWGASSSTAFTPSARCFSPRRVSWRRSRSSLT
ncbi:hypothetical protein M8494_10120 [Serratia ureilytica]